MKSTLLYIWTRIFARPIFRRVNSLILELAVRGVGVGSCQDDSISGESWFVRHCLPNLLKGTPKPILVDVGANEGAYSLLLRSSFSTGRIFSFEPGPGTFRKLSAISKEIDGEAINQAVGSTNGMAVLFDYTGSSANSQHASLFREVIESQHGGDALATEVPITTLDDFCAQRGIESIDFLKLDVEGNELSCLEGAKRLLQDGKIRVIQFEFNSMNLCSRVTMHQFRAVLPHHHLYRLLPNSLLLLNPKDPVSSNLFFFQNIVAVPFIGDFPKT